MTRPDSRALLLLSVLCVCARGWGQEPFLLDVSSDGSDGEFSPPGRVEIDLALAASGPGVNWLTPSTDPGDGSGGPGVYDPEKWAVVFKFDSVHIPPQTTVMFKNHPSRAPVVWLVRSDVVIDGWVFLNGASGAGAERFATEPGPGGFRGGFGFDVGSTIRSAGFGPGGGGQIGDQELSRDLGGAGAYALDGETAGSGIAYGNEAIVPLIGGSGGGGGRLELTRPLRRGSAGGGAILIAAGGSITINSSGRIQADASVTGNANTGGSGGAIRLLAQFVLGNGFVSAQGGSWAGGPGRVHVVGESTLRQSFPPYTFAPVGDPPLLWPPATAPRIRVARVRSASIGSLAVPADPRASFAGFPNADLSFNTDEPVTIEVAAANVPLDWILTVRVVPKVGEALIVPGTPTSGDAAASVWEATVVPPPGIAAVQAHARAATQP